MVCIRKFCIKDLWRDFFWIFRFQSWRHFKSPQPQELEALSWDSWIINLGLRTLDTLGFGSVLVSEIKEDADFPSSPAISQTSFIVVGNFGSSGNGICLSSFFTGSTYTAFIQLWYINEQTTTFFTQERVKKLKC